MGKVRAAFLLDVSWSVPQEEQVELMLYNLGEYLGPDKIETVAIANGFHVLKDKTFDLLVVDYGGIVAHGAWDTAEWQLRRVLEWAREHPGGIVLLFTFYTKKVYEGELEREFGHQDNVLMRYRDSGTEDEEIGGRLRAWFLEQPRSEDSSDG